MKVFTYMILILALSLSSCSSQKKMVAQAPIEMGSATCQSWAGGRAESGSGMLLQIPVLNDNLDGKTLQQAFFRGKVADITMENTENGWLAMANFKNQTMEKPDIIMHADSKKEVGNQPPQVKEKFPFELEKDECVISFIDGDTLKYFKVSNIKDKAPKMFK